MYTNNSVANLEYLSSLSDSWKYLKYSELKQTGISKY